ncbi:MAG: DNA polymerase III subunit epsilon [Lachnospiraceae bacterium]|mgnify:FL=1|jgi:DNA polymerase-3 subunit epsilon|nr:DNA polymerase III subunit epsilon [Lachnospiraceae bacterium]GFI17653.1 DNA polymerase III PolC-type [Lachnospiraceae bacterium]
MKERNKGRRLNDYLKDYVVFDLETTGINQNVDKIVEISAVKVCGHEIVGEYSTLVNPCMHIPAAATAVNGITDEMVADAPGIKEAVEGFVAFIGDSVLVGHNIHTFDTNFIYDAVWEEMGKELKNNYIDTLYMARRCLPMLSHHKLTDVASYFQIETKGAHRALFDCIMNQKCYEEIGRLFLEMKKAEKEKQKNGGGENEDDGSCPSCGGLLVKRKGRYGYFYGCEEFPRCRYTRKI